MAFKTLGLTSDLQINIPSKRDTNWADQLESDAWLRIVQHDHASTGGGRRIQTAAIADSAITTNKIADANITAAKMAANSVATANIIDANVTTAKILDANVTAAKLATNAALDNISSGTIVTAKLADDSVDDTKIRLRNAQWLTARNAANSADVNIARVNSSNEVELGGTFVVADNTISTAKLQDGSVTKAKQSAANTATSPLISTGALTNTTIANVTDGSVSITTSGRPVLISFSGDSAVGSITSSGGQSDFKLSTNSDPTISSGTISHTMLSAGSFSPGVLTTVAILAAGTYTIYLSAERNGATSYNIDAIRMTATEL